jgi:hypothetical protein
MSGYCQSLPHFCSSFHTTWTAYKYDCGRALLYTCSMWTSLIVGMAVALTVFNVVLYLNKHDIMGAPTVML